MAPQPLSRRASRHAASRLQAVNGPTRLESVCLELQDHSVVHRSAVEFFRLLRNQRDPQAQAARMAKQFITQNRELMSKLCVQTQQEYDGNDVVLTVQSESAIGAIPLFSPTTGRLDYGLVVQPRFPWPGIGAMLSQMGWRITPSPLPLPLLRRSERRVPVWVLSSMILMRLQSMLKSLDRKFEITTEIRSAPKGQVEWTRYAVQSVSRGNLLSIPCSFADLRDDRLLKGAIRYTLERQVHALETQREHGIFILKLIEFAQGLLRTLQSVPAYVPPVSVMGTWMQQVMHRSQFTEGLQAIEWTIEERGLAGLSDLAGIPWTMPMNQFFEAWVETVFRIVALQTGGQVQVGRKRETTHPISWDPPYLGSQKSLIPDIWLEWDSTTLIIDAKYKRHWEELQRYQWSEIAEKVRSEHREDLLQVLAYANLARTERVIACLVYPCSSENWLSLNQRGRVLHKAEISVGSRLLHLWLTAMPMASLAERVASPLSGELRSVLSMC